MQKKMTDALAEAFIRQLSLLLLLSSPTRKLGRQSYFPYLRYTSAMEKKRKGDKRPYAERLLPKSKIRYEKKLLLIDGNDPYELPTNVWSVNPDDLPEITYITIVNYFVLGKSRYTSEEFRAYKSLESYKTFVAGWVRDIRCYQPQGCPNVVVSAKVLHSQRLNEAPLTPWVIVTADGSNILSAHCTCKAGIGETCSHVGALTFACDAFTTTKEKATCTGVKAYWKVPQGIRGVKPAPAYKIDFSSARAKKDRLNKFIQDADAVVPEVAQQKKLPDVAEPSSDELATFFSELKLTPGTPNILKLLPQYCDEYATENLVPATLQRLFDANCEGMTLEELQEHCRTIPVQVTEEQCCKIEEATRLQSKSDVWFASRAGRITASNLYDACHTDPHNPSRSLVRKIVYPEEHKFSNCATDWGKENEAVALDDYRTVMECQHSNFTTSSSGLHVSPDLPFMGASPDAIVNCDCHGKGCVEVKCPYNQRYKTIDEAVKDPGFCLQIVSGVIRLPIKHRYYSQVQCQLYLAGAMYCDFVVWTTVEVYITRIFRNSEFWDICTEKAAQLFRLAILPEIVGRWMKNPVNELPPAKKSKNEKHTSGSKS